MGSYQMVLFVYLVLLSVRVKCWVFRVSVCVAGVVGDLTYLAAVAEVDVAEPSPEEFRPLFVLALALKRSRDCYSKDSSNGLLLFVIQGSCYTFLAWAQVEAQI